MEISLEPKKTVCLFILIASGLLFAHVCGLFSTYYFGHPRVYGLVRLFDFDAEQNVPSLYSTVMLFFSALLLLTIAANKKHESGSYASHWLWLGYIFVFLSLDEACSVHEKLMLPLRSVLHASGLLFYTWVVPYSIILIFFMLSYIDFTLKLPTKTRFLFITSGAVFICGAIGIEMLGGRHASLYGKSNVLFASYCTIEELLEITGIVIFIYALMSYIKCEFGGLSLTIKLSSAGSPDYNESLEQAG